MAETKVAPALPGWQADVALLVDEMRRTLAASPECFQVWLDWHLPRVLRASGYPSPLPSRPISVREAQVLRDMEEMFYAHGCWVPGMRPLPRRGKA
jgi:hypothetical protein